MDGSSAMTVTKCVRIKDGQRFTCIHLQEKEKKKNRYKLYNGSFFFSINYSNRCNLFICGEPFFHCGCGLLPVIHVCIPAHLFLCRSITRAYYRNSVGGLLLFDITNRRSFQNVHNWLEEAQSHVQPHSIIFLLVGHKCDLEAQRQVTQQEAEKLAGAYGMRYVETSARDAINVEKV